MTEPLPEVALKDEEIDQILRTEQRRAYAQRRAKPASKS
jgi:hypothetical protein